MSCTVGTTGHLSAEASGPFDLILVDLNSHVQLRLRSTLFTCPGALAGLALAVAFVRAACALRGWWRQAPVWPLTDLSRCAPSQSPTLTLQSTNTHTQSSSSSSDGGLFRSRPTHSLPPGEDGRVEPYVDFAEFYRLWSVDHGEQSVATAP